MLKVQELNQYWDNGILKLRSCNVKMSVKVLRTYNTQSQISNVGSSYGDWDFASLAWLCFHVHTRLKCLKRAEINFLYAFIKSWIPIYPFAESKLEITTNPNCTKYQLLLRISLSSSFSSQDQSSRSILLWNINLNELQNISRVEFLVGEQLANFLLGLDLVGAV